MADAAHSPHTERGELCVTRFQQHHTSMHVIVWYLGPQVNGSCKVQQGILMLEISCMFGNGMSKIHHQQY